jgi:capsular exopolysaccharide synthesis family protein
MSRIYDALKKAELDRQAQPQNGSSLPIDQAIVAPAVIPEPVFQTGATPMNEVESEAQVKRLPWNLDLNKLPAMQATNFGGEIFRRLRSRLLEMRDEKTFKSFLITSGLPGEGKTFIATNLAVTLAGRDNSRVLLIDGDLRRPSAHTILGAASKPGFAEYLAGTAEIADILQHGPIPNLSFIPGGEGTEQAAELTADRKVAGLLASVADAFDWIIVDSSPVIPVSDPVNLARACDAVLLVTRAVSTPFPIAQKVKNELSGSRLLGLVLNGVEDSPSSSYGYYQGYPASGHKKPAAHPEGARA